MYVQRRDTILSGRAGHKIISLVVFIFSLFALLILSGAAPISAGNIECIDSRPHNVGNFNQILKKYMPPSLQPNASARPDVIWPEDGKGEPKNSTVTLKLKTAGGPAIAFKPQDTVFVMDCSQTMRYISDPNDLRLLAAQHYVNNMIPPDRCAAVRFSSGAELVNNHSLTSNYTQIDEDLASLYGTAAGQTNFLAAFDNATKELESHGNPNHMWIEIFLTDGRPEPSGTNVTATTLARFQANNITVFTIGLGMAQDRNLLRWIASETGGRYYDAPNASALDDIYSDIANQFKDYTASYGGMLYYILPKGVRLVNGTLSNTTGNVTLSFDETTTLNWSLPKMMLDDEWNASFNITSVITGWVHLSVFPESRIDYTNWSHAPDRTVFPDIRIWVIPPSPAPPPMPLPPPAPPTPVPVPPPALMAPVTQAAVTVQPVFSLTPVTQPTGISTAELIAPFTALGLGSFAKMKKKLKTKKKIDIGVRERPRDIEKKKDHKRLAPKSKGMARGTTKKPAGTGTIQG